MISMCLNYKRGAMTKHAFSAHAAYSITRKPIWMLTCLMLWQPILPGARHYYPCDRVTLITVLARVRGIYGWQKAHVSRCLSIMCGSRQAQHVSYQGMC